MFRLHYITMYFADIKFPNKESVTTQAFVFSRFKKQTPKSSSWMPVNLDTDYKRNTKWIPDLISKVLPCTATFKLGFTCRHKTHEMIFLKIFKVPFLHVEESPGSCFQMGLNIFFFAVDGNCYSDFTYDGEQCMQHIIWFTSPFDVLTDSDRCLDLKAVIW